jgi:protein-tyrosine phosphatase
MTSRLVAALFLSLFLSSQTTEKKLKVLQIALEDSVDADLLSILHETTTFFSNAKEEDEKILVFCNAGVSRSVAVALAYIVWKKAKKMMDGKRIRRTRIVSTAPYSSSGR